MIYANGAWCQQDLKHHHLTLPETADLAQNRPLSCMPETTTHVPYVYCNEWSKEKKEHTSTVMITCCAGIVDKVH